MTMMFGDGPGAIIWLYVCVLHTINVILAIGYLILLAL